MLARYRKRHPGSTIAQLLFYDLIRETALLILRLFYRMRSVDVTNIPREGAVLIIANHQSFFDPPIVSSVIRHRHTDFLARGGLFKFKPFGWTIRQLNSTPINQGAGDAGAMKETLRKLGEGKMMLVFPEGSRTHDGNMQEFQRGVAVLLKRAHCQVVPVGIAGAFDAWPRTRRFPKLFARRIAVCYGQPIASDELMSKGTDQAIATLYERVKELVAKAESNR